jgi:hypothetical protein
MGLFAAVSVLHILDTRKRLMIEPVVFSVVVPFRSQEFSADEYPCLLIYRTPAIE